MSGMVRCAHYRNISTSTQFLCSNYRDQVYLPLKASTKHCKIRHHVPKSFDQRKPFQGKTVPIQVHQRPRRPGGALITENNSPRFRRTKVSRTLLQPRLPSQFPLVSLPASFYAGRLSTPSRPPPSGPFLRAILFGGFCEHFPNLCAGEPGVFPCKIVRVLVIEIRCRRQIS